MVLVYVFYKLGCIEIQAEILMGTTGETRFCYPASRLRKRGRRVPTSTFAIHSAIILPYKRAHMDTRKMCLCIAGDVDSSRMTREQWNRKLILYSFEVNGCTAVWYSASIGWQERISRFFLMIYFITLATTCERISTWQITRGHVY